MSGKQHVKHEGDGGLRRHISRLLKDHPHRHVAEQFVETAHRIAQDDMDLLDLKIISSSARELRYAFSVFKDYRHIRKVSVFGSARIPTTDPHYQEAVRFGRLLVKHGWMMITGAASGIMQAGNEGAGTKKSFGVNILLPFEQEANEFMLGDRKLIHFKYFFTRKLIFLKESDAVVLFPGGFGTHDEGFEAITLVQTGKTTPRPIVMVDIPGGTYWKEFDHFIRHQIIGKKYASPEDTSLYKVVNSPEAAVRELIKFYSNYHSMRFFHDSTMIRLRKKPSAKLLSGVNRKFQHLLTHGSFESVKPRPEEKQTEPENLKYHRIEFAFHRKNFAELRLLIDFLNTNG